MLQLTLAWIALLAIPAPPESAMLELERSSQCGRWHLAVYASGFVHTNVGDTCGGPAKGAVLRRISAQEVERIRKALRTAQFHTLPTSLTPPTAIPDEDVLTIWSRVTGEVGTVGAFGVDRLEDKEVARRFELVWGTVAAIVPDFK